MEFRYYRILSLLNNDKKVDQLLIAKKPDNWKKDLLVIGDGKVFELLTTN